MPHNVPKPNHRFQGASLAWILFISLAFMRVAPAQGQAPAKPVEGLADLQKYLIEVELQPEARTLKARVTVDLLALGPLSELTFELNRNCLVTQVFDGRNRELEHRQDDFENFTVRVLLREPVKAGDSFQLVFLYDGSFDKTGRRARGSVLEIEPFVGPDGAYLPYASKWIPVYRFLTDRASSRIVATVPLGFTAIGPGRQVPSQPKGVSEVFEASCDQPILPGSLVVGQYFPKSLDQDGLSIDFLVAEDALPACEKVHAALKPYARYFKEKFNSLPWGDTLTVVQVPAGNDYMPGAPGVLYLTDKQLQALKPDSSDLARRLAYQWWAHAMPIARWESSWLQEALSFYAPVLCLGESKDANAAREEMQTLEIIALQSEGRSSISNAFRLGYQSEDYMNLAGGKGAWVLHMLRMVIGDDKFVRLLSRWHANFGQLTAVTPDFQELANTVAGEDLKWFFIQWIESIGVPQFETEYLLIKTRKGFRISGSIKQDKDLFRMPVELAIESKGKTVRAPVVVQGKRSDFRVDVDTMPTLVLVDPDGNLLRDSEDRKVAVFIARGRRQHDRAQYVEAIQQFEEALRINPRRSLANFYLGETLWEQFNMQSAANAFREALNGDLEPKWVEVWSYIYIGKIFDVLGQRDRAVAEYQKAVNTKNDYNGAQEEVQKYIREPFNRKRTVLDRP